MHCSGRRMRVYEDSLYYTSARRELGRVETIEFIGLTCVLF
jgi:hypothetical protein